MHLKLRGCHHLSKMLLAFWLKNANLTQKIGRSCRVLRAPMNDDFVAIGDPAFIGRHRNNSCSTMEGETKKVQ